MRPNREKGGTVIAAIFIVVFLAIIGLIITVYAISAAEEAGNEYLSTQALYYAESGIYYSLMELEATDSIATLSYSFTGPGGTATIAASSILSGKGDGSVVWTIESTGVAGNDSTDKFGKRTIRVIYRR